MITAQLQQLLVLQEIDTLLEDFADESRRKAEQTLGFSLGSLTGVRGKRTKVAHSLSPEILRRYEQVRKRHLRAVVPVRRGVCLGCFTHRPTNTLGRRGQLETCERCGRILFVQEERPQTP